LDVRLRERLGTQKLVVATILYGPIALFCLGLIGLLLFLLGWLIWTQWLRRLPKWGLIVGLIAWAVAILTAATAAEAWAGRTGRPSARCQQQRGPFCAIFRRG
jgi:uncharacterized membrane protein YbhN (UPF0104 family)